MFNSDFIHIISIFHLDFSHIRVRNQVQKSSPYKSTFPRSRVTLYNHEMGVKFENFDLFEHTSAFKMIIFSRIGGNVACFACFEGLNISVCDSSFIIHSYFNQILFIFHPDFIYIQFVFHLCFIYRERRPTKNSTSTPAIPPPFGSWLELQNITLERGKVGPEARLDSFDRCIFGPPAPNSRENIENPRAIDFSCFSLIKKIEKLDSIGARTYEHFGEKPNYCEKQFQELYAELSIVGGSVGMCVAKQKFSCFFLLLLIGIVPLGTLGYLLIPSFGAKTRAGNARTGNVNFSWIRTLSFLFLMTGRRDCNVCKIWAGYVPISKSYD